MQALQRQRDLQHLLGGDLPAILHRAKHGRLFHQLLEARFHLDRILERDVQHLRNELGEPIPLRVRQPEDPTDVAQHALCLERSEGDDLANVLFPVLLGYILNDVVPPLLTEVDVEIRHRDPLRIEEPLEQKVVGNGIEVGDPQRVRHQRAGARAPAWTDWNPLFLGPVDEVLDDQKVTGETHRRDDR